MDAVEADVTVFGYVGMIDLGNESDQWRIQRIAAETQGHI